MDTLAHDVGATRLLRVSFFSTGPRVVALCTTPLIRMTTGTAYTTHVSPDAVTYATCPGIAPDALYTTCSGMHTRARR